RRGKVARHVAGSRRGGRTSLGNGLPRNGPGVGFYFRDQADRKGRRRRGRRREGRRQREVAPLVATSRRPGERPGRREVTATARVYPSRSALRRRCAAAPPRIDRP